jgi:putative lipoprotein
MMIFIVFRSRVLGLALLSSVIIGCAAGPAQMSTPDTQGVLRGSVAYRERIALPPDAVVEVWLIDVSPLIVAQVLIAETTVPSRGRQVPIPFELRYDPKKIQPDHTYAVKAAIRSAGQILFETPTPHPVITKGNPLQAELWLQRAAP